MPSETINQMSEHLKFLGYQVEQKDQLTIAKHPKKMNILARDFKGGIMFTSINNCTDTAKSDKAGYLAYINLLNSKAQVARFYAGNESELYIEAWYPDYYDKNKFGVFIEAWETDSTILLFVNSAEAIKYLK